MGSFQPCFSKCRIFLAQLLGQIFCSGVACRFDAQQRQYHSYYAEPCSIEDSWPSSFTMDVVNALIEETRPSRSMICSL